MTTTSKQLISLAALTIATGLSVNAHAGDVKPKAGMGEFRLFGGAAFFNDRHELYEAGKKDHLTFETPSLELGLGLGYYFTSFFGIEGEAAFILPNAEGDNGGSVLLINPRAHLVLQFPARVTPFVLAGGGVHLLTGGKLGEDADREFHWGAGLKFFLSENIALRLEGRQLISPEYEPQGTNRDNVTTHYEALGGLTFAFGGGPNLDEDKDGVLLPTDKCPEIKGTMPNGCADQDNDGISDIEDACPSVAGTVGGCPDEDGDKVIDSKDKCLGVPGEIAFEGCPNPDRDGDGVKNEDDKCPDIAGVKDGCPDQDLDGFIDSEDKCPAEAEIVNGFQDSDGCPDAIPAAVKRFTGKIDGINFASGRSTIRRSSYKKLNQAVVVLIKYPDLRLIIEGYTDSAGREAANQALSQKRADAVKAYFVKKGVDENRLTSIGYGEDRPIASNKTRRGRAQNRRIEFKLAQ